MRHPPLAALALLPLATPTLLLAASPQTLEACAGIESDARRLQCYDALAGRGSHDASLADQAAAEARLAAEDVAVENKPADPAESRLRQRVDELFKYDESASAQALGNAGRGSLLDSRWELARDSKLGTFNLRAYKPVYLLPAFWTSETNELPYSPNPANRVTTPQNLQNTELKFQLSFKTKVAENLFGDNGDVWVGYTQSSRWQAYNSETSRPFRETNYEPEAILVFRNSYHLGGWAGRMTGISLTHQSNGRADPLSRSWNRVILNVGLDRENWALVLRPWYRIEEDAEDDNNHDMEDYIGRGDATLTYHRDGHEVSLMARHSLRGGDRSHGALQLDWGFPINNLLRGHVQVFDGYGESMIDYNHKATYIGLGVSLLEWY
ncbi:phospholipase [Pseudoxanthomonas kalamensis DSM 18571]|uniref:phospholipase A n=1 Tax=Pseudoxanthomonas kalamensis TaxID=289483 RepID=UPI001391E725|nr:phospholipase A [Pseudoxanthomonas kalamensis]KAF1710633.1 phospholipase [Pseudoxanthomonas kalamensis DSM 18571]